MMKKIIFAILPVIIIFTLIIWLERNVYSFQGNSVRKIKIGSKVIQAEEVSSSEKKRKGLGGRKILCSKCGMLFVFSKNDWRVFVMRDMKFPLDFIWISGNEVVGISKNISQNFSGMIVSPAEADKVLEINAGVAEIFNFQKGDKVFYQ